VALRHLRSGDNGTSIGGIRNFLESDGQRYAISAPLAAPVIDGYPGALHLYRSANEREFSAAEAKHLEGIVRQFDERIAEQRSVRRQSCEPAPYLTPRPSARFFVFDGELRELSLYNDTPLDEHVAEQLVALARPRLTGVRRNAGDAEREQVRDEHGELWTFRVLTRPDLPGLCNELTGSACVVFCLQPDCCEWGQLRPGDVQADNELARLVPAIRFMLEDFSRSPTLDEIAHVVHLSPFHFHRRFAELFGLTPKHLLLECQINQAKRELVAREKELARIATECGFAHQSHFTSRFKQATGLTPTRWRRLALNSA
jgi:AraC-like DNA-binding protein